MKKLFFDSVSRFFILFIVLLYVLLFATVKVNAQKPIKGSFKVVETYSGGFLTLKDVREYTRFDNAFFTSYEWTREGNIYKLTLYRDVLKDNTFFVYTPENGDGVFYESIDNEFLTFFNN